MTSCANCYHHTRVNRHGLCADCFIRLHPILGFLARLFGPDTEGAMSIRQQFRQLRAQDFQALLDGAQIDISIWFRAGTIHNYPPWAALRLQDWMDLYYFVATGCPTPLSQGEQIERLRQVVEEAQLRAAWAPAQIM